MVGLPRSIIKKYGVTKKAWAIFRGGKKRYRTRVSKGRVTVYAYPKRRSVRYMGKKRYHRRSGGGGFNTNRLLNAALWSAGASLIAPKLGVNVDSRVVSAGVGFWKGGLAGGAIGYFIPGFIGGATGNGTIFY